MPFGLFEGSALFTDNDKHICPFIVISNRECLYTEFIYFYFGDFIFLRHDPVVYFDLLRVYGPFGWLFLVDGAVRFLSPSVPGLGSYSNTKVQAELGLN